MPRSPRILSMDELQKYLAKIMIQVEKGQIETKRANSISGLAGRFIEAYKVQNNEDDTEIARQLLDKQDEIIEEVRGGGKPRIIDIKEGVD